MDKWRGSLLVAISLIVAYSGCGGGQTGQPTAGSSGGAGCDVEVDVRCCREGGIDERVSGLTAREIVAQHARTEVPVFWTPGTAHDPRWLEPEDAEEDELTVAVTLDESAPVMICNEASHSIPVEVVLTTSGGYEARSTGTLSSIPNDATPVAFSLVPGEDESFDDGAQDCSSSFYFSELGLVGRLCDGERRLGLFPTACGGIVQAPPDEAPFADVEAPAEFLAGLEEVTLSYQELPPLALTSRVEDASACYGSTSSYAMQTSFEVDSGGARFSGEGVSGSSQVRETLDSDGRPVELQWIEFAEFCGDVSSSPEWKAVRDALGAEGELCVSPAYGKSRDGELVYVAEVSFDDAETGWVFTGP